MARHSVLIARFPYGGGEYRKGVNWLVETVCKIKRDRRVDQVDYTDEDDTPIPMLRNRACKAALDGGYDFVLMLDNDLHPDYQATRPFWDSSFDFLLRHAGPAVVAAPYCGPPPEENVYVFLWRKYQSENPNPDYRLEQFTREEAAGKAGIEEVAALPTGLILFHTEVVKRLPLPWFEYEYADRYRTHKASTEDVYFTRNASLAGVPVYCNWDAWAGHRKVKTVGKPEVNTAAGMRRQLPLPEERLVRVPPGGLSAP